MARPVLHAHHPPHPPSIEGPHLSGAGGWAILAGFLAFTVLGIVLYLVRLSQAAT
ncbi:MAG: hypothetical protein ACYC2H_00895 [Thermoplasmatota archaeon]